MYSAKQKAPVATVITVPVGDSIIANDELFWGINIFSLHSHSFNVMSHHYWTTHLEGKTRLWSAARH